MVKPWYRVVCDDGRVLLEFAGALTVVEGSAATTLVPRLLELLDGTRSYREIVEVLGPPIAPAVDAAMDVLLHAGAITEGPPLHPSIPRPAGEVATLLAATTPAGPGLSTIAARLDTARVAVIGDSALARAIAVALAEAGLGDVAQATRVEPGDCAGLDLAVVAGDRDALAAFNRGALAAGPPWLPIERYDGRLAGVGPLVLPGETCCWTCVRLRRGSTGGYASELRILEAKPAASFRAGPLDLLVSGLACLLALRWIAHRDASLPGVLWALEPWPAPRITSHVVYRLPRCPECSPTAGLAAPSPWAEADAA